MRFFLLLFWIAFSTGAFGNSQDGFIADAYSGCAPLLVNFTDTTSNAVSWYWNFGNGNISAKPTPSATFLTSGAYAVKLIVTTGQGTTDTIVKNIRVYKAPTVDFTADKTLACAGTLISFQNLVTPGDAPVNQYGWGLGNGTDQGGANTTYTYNQPGVYTVTLVVQDTNGCAANNVKNNYINIIPPPQAAFTASPAATCDSSQLVSFTNHSTGTGLTYSWVLSDTATSTLENPTYLYKQQAFDVALTVTDSSGCTSQVAGPVYALTVVANFAISSPSVCTGMPLSFINETTIMPGNFFTWSFGDGTFSNAISPDKKYAASGDYSVTLIVKNGSCIDSITKPNAVVITPGIGPISPSFTADNTLSCGQPLTVSFTNTTTGGNAYYWNFGNGDTSDVEDPTVTYDTTGHYSVTLTVKDTLTGCVISTVSENLVNIGWPVAMFKISDTLTCAGGAISFVNESSNGTNCLWTFGDGDSSTLPSPPHTYTTNGNYTVTLTEFNSAGCQSSVSEVNSVHVDSVHVDFKVNATFSPCPPFACILQNESSPSVIRFFWDFGDGYTSTLENPTHIYFYPGVYTVKLIGYTVTGCIDTMVYPNLITVQGPTGSFKAYPTTGCVPLTVLFTDTVSSTTKNFWCDLGDGNVISDSSGFSNTYTQVRTYHPQFILVDHVGCTVPYTIDSIITHGVTAFQVNDTSVCASSTLNVSINQSGNNYQWSPPVFLSCDTCSSVAINDTGNATYQITGTNRFGCQNLQTMQITVVPLPQLNDSASFSLCHDDTFPLFIGNAASITWSPGLYLSDSTSINPVCTPTASVTYTVNAFNSIGCMVTAKVPVTVGSKVDLSLMGDTTICENGSIELQTKINFASSSGIHYSWSPASYLSNPNAAEPVATLGTTPVVFRVIASSGHCLPDTQSVTISAAQMPDIQASPPVFTTPYAQVQLYAESHQELDYKWFSNDSLSCEDEQCDRIFVYPSASQTVYVEGTSQYGCVVKDAVVIDMQGCNANSIFMPNTFTPNGDGLNDKFLIRSKALSTIQYFRVFDEWGQLVFETNQLDQGWDGTIASRPAPMATYVYMLEGKCENGYDVMKKGSVSIVR